MAFGQLSPDLLQTITIAVQTSGQQAILDLQAQLARTEKAIDQWKLALQRGIVPATQFNDEVERLVADQRMLQQSIKASQAVMNGFPAGFQLSGQAALSLSYALDDLQYGFSAIVNNAPHLALALGLGPGAAGAMGVLFVAANVLSKHLPSVSARFEELGRSVGLLRDPLRDAGSDVEGLGEKIKALETQPVRLQADYQSIDRLKGELRDLERVLKAYEKARDDVTKEKKAGRESIHDAIVDVGGPDKVKQALTEIKRRDGTLGISEFEGERDYHESLAGTLQSAQDKIPDTPWYVNPAAAWSRYGLQMQIDEQRSQAAKAQQKIAGKLEEQIGGMLDLRRGDASAKELEDLAADPANEEVFARHGIDALRLRGGAANATRQAILDPQRRKIAAESAKEAARALAERNRLHEEAQRKQEAFEKHQADTDPDITGKFRDRRLQSQIDVTDDDARQRAQDSAREAREAKAADAQGRRDANARARDARNAAVTPAQEKRQAEASYGQEFQARARNIGIPITGQQATVAGKDVAGMVGNGVDVDSAMQQALANLGNLVRRQNMQALRNAAAWEQMNNMVGEASTQLMLVEQQQRRNQVQRPHGNVR